MKKATLVLALVFAALSGSVLAQNQAPVRVLDSTLLDFSRTATARIGTDVYVRAYEAPVGMLLEQLARSSRYTLSASAGANLAQAVSPSLTAVTTEEAAAAVARLGGLALQVDTERRIWAIQPLATRVSATAAQLH